MLWITDIGTTACIQFSSVSIVTPVNFITGIPSDTWTNWYSVSTVNTSTIAYGAISGVRSLQTGIITPFSTPLYLALSSLQPFYFVTSNQDTSASPPFYNSGSSSDRWLNYWYNYTTNKPFGSYTNQNNTIYPFTSGQRSAVALNISNNSNNILSFSVPVTNVCFAFMSLGGSSSPTQYLFDQDFTVVSSATAVSDTTWGYTAPPLARYTTTYNGTTYYGVSSNEGNGIIQFNSSMSILNWVVLTPESWCNIQVAATPMLLI
jgi:hypothetical protein